jgi:5-methylcytosine-specific restriction enzyme subunit McrC
MRSLNSLSGLLSGKAFLPAHPEIRTVISAVEYETKLLPSDIIRPDGSLNLYDDVQKLFRPTFDKGRPAVQCGGWIGYIPLNDKYALEVNARVPLENLERLIGFASGYSPTILKKYKRYFAHTAEQPPALFEILSSHFLSAFERICDAGLLRTYDREEHAGTSPAGRIRPFQSALLSKIRGSPVAAFSSYRRTVDNGPNRIAG